jgi:hypothetical protein
LFCDLLFYTSVIWTCNFLDWSAPFSAYNFSKSEKATKIETSFSNFSTV